MSDEEPKRGSERKLVVPVPFEDAVKAALETKPPPMKKRKAARPNPRDERDEG